MNAYIGLVHKNYTLGARTLLFKESPEMSRKPDLEKISIGKPSFDQTIASIIEKTLYTCFGDSAANSVFQVLEHDYSLRKEEIPHRFDDFLASLQKIFKEGSFAVEKIIAKRICEEFGLGKDEADKTSLRDIFLKLKARNLRNHELKEDATVLEILKSYINMLPEDEQKIIVADLARNFLQGEFSSVLSEAGIQVPISKKVEKMNKDMTKTSVRVGIAKEMMKIMIPNRLILSKKGQRQLCEGLVAEKNESGEIVIYEVTQS